MNIDDSFLPKSDEEIAMELASFAGTFSSNVGLNNSQVITSKDVEAILKNPYANLEQTRRISESLSNSKGILREYIRTLKTLPKLDYLILLNIDKPQKLKKVRSDVENFLSQIQVKELIRDIIGEIAVKGTAIPCLRKKSYIELLNLDLVRVQYQVNGQWVVEYDLEKAIAYYVGLDSRQLAEVMPDEINTRLLNAYLKNPSDDKRFVPLSNCFVLSLDNMRNQPYGLPAHMGAWESVMQKQMIDKVERAISDRMTKQIMLLKGGFIDAEKKKPVSPEVLKQYVQNFAKVIIKRSTENANESGTGVVSVPHFIDVDTVKIESGMFSKEVYEKINNDIFMNLGISPALIYGGSGTYSAGQISVDRTYQFIQSLVDKAAFVINEFVKVKFPKIDCKIRFSENQDDKVDKYRELYLQTGVSRYWVEELTGIPLEYTIAQLKYEQEELKVDEVFNPPLNAHTMSSKDNNGAGRPTVDDPNNENTDKSKSNGGNDLPKPSTE